MSVFLMLMRFNFDVLTSEPHQFISFSTCIAKVVDVAPAVYGTYRARNLPAHTHNIFEATVLN